VGHVCGLASRLCSVIPTPTGGTASSGSQGKAGAFASLSVSSLLPFSCPANRADSDVVGGGDVLERLLILYMAVVLLL